MTAGAMGALVYEAPSVMSYRTVDVPAPGRADVLVRVAYSGICGSELSGYLGQSSLRRPPLIFGHEVSGSVAAVGAEVADVAVGDRVVVNPLVTCGACRYCLTGRQQLCPHRLLLGASLPGANAELVVAPAASVLPVPAGLDLRDAAMVEPAAFALHAVAAAAVVPAMSALVVGAGPIGLLVLQVLREWGVARRYVVERNPARRAMAEALGCVALPADGGDLRRAVADANGGCGVDVAFDAVGTPATRSGCLSTLDPGGSLVLVGLHTDETALPLNTVVRSEIRIVGAFAYTPGDFRNALDWIGAGRIGLTDGVVVAPLAEGGPWYQRLVDGDPAAKVLLQPGPVPA